MSKHPNDVKKIIPHTEDVYISFTFLKVRILDSLRLCPFTSIESMGFSLSKNISKAEILNKYKLKPQKGFFPYYVLGETFEEVNDLLLQEKFPTRKAFNTNLHQYKISKKDYTIAFQSWVDSNCKNLKEYTLKYMKLDVLILADFIENFRQVSLKYYEIDPCYCYSAPGLSWCAGMKFTKVKLKYFKEETYNQLLFFEKGVRGGISSVHG